MWRGPARAAVTGPSPPESASRTGARTGTAVYYQIRVQGHLDDTWSEWFEGLTITRLANGETALGGYLVDQAALHGVLIKVRDLGLPLLGVILMDGVGAGGALR